MYHTGPGVKKSGPKGPTKIKGGVLDALVHELDSHPSDASHLIAQRVTKKMGTKISARAVRKLRNQRGKTGLSRQTRREASAPTNHPMYS